MATAFEPCVLVAALLPMATAFEPCEYIPDSEPIETFESPVTQFEPFHMR
jgi:hypothetical protein